MAAMIRRHTATPPSSPAAASSSVRPALSSSRPHDRSRLSLVSYRAHSFVEHGCRVAHQVGGRKAAPEVEDAGSNGPADARYPLHLADDLIDLWYDVDSEGRDAGVEGGVRI